MIGTRDIKLHAARPDLPLEPIFSHLASPSSLRILNVPKKIGLWEITNVFVTVVYPDNSAHSVEAVKSGGVYVATIPASDAPGKAMNGLEITANGLDENGEVVEGYVLGVADVYVLDRDGSITIGATTYYLHLVDEKPATPHKGDLVKTDYGWEIFDGVMWIGFGGGTGATVLTMNGGKLYNGADEITQYSALLSLVQAGGVVLLGEVAGKDALFYPLFCDANEVRFDATGTLGSAVQTKSYAMTPKTGGGITISPSGLNELVKYDDFNWSKLRNKPTAKRVVRNFNRDEVNNTAIIKSFKIPTYLKERLTGKVLRCIRMQGPTTATGSWDSTGVALRLTSEPFTVLIPATSEIEIGKPVEFVKDDGFFISTDDDYIHIYSPLGKSKFGLVPVDSSLGYDIVFANGNHITNYAPFLEFVEKDGTVITTAIDEMMSSMVAAGAVRKLATNATQSQIISKVNELISKFEEV